MKLVAPRVDVRVPARPTGGGARGRAAAVGEASGPEAGLEIVDRLTGLEDYRYLCFREQSSCGASAGRADARDAYVRAIELTHDKAEQGRRRGEFA